MVICYSAIENEYETPVMTPLVPQEPVNGSLVLDQCSNCDEETVVKIAVCCRPVLWQIDPYKDGCKIISQPACFSSTPPSGGDSGLHDWLVTI